MKKLEQRALSPEMVEGLVRVVGTKIRLGDLLSVDVAVVEGWMHNGVEAGLTSAALRAFAKANHLSLTAEAALARCCLCRAHAARESFGCRICVRCSREPVEAFRTLGFKVSDRDDNQGGGWGYYYGVESERVRFEHPLHATFQAQGSKPPADEPEVGHDEFDDAVLIRTDDYEFLFDMMQLARRRSLVQELVGFGRLTINVNQVSVWRAAPAVDEQQLGLALALLCWSFAFERSS